MSTAVLEATEMAKKKASKAGGERAITSVALPKKLAKMIALVAKHKGKKVPELIELWLHDVVASEYRAMLEEMSQDLDD